METYSSLNKAGVTLRLTLNINVYYGAQAPKLSRILGCTIPEAERYIESFWSGNKGVKYIIDDLEKQYKKNKFIVGLDGRKLQIRQKYKLLNTLIQSSAAIVFKRWGLIANERLRAAGNHCRQIIAYHDEYCYRCNPDHLEESKQIILDSAIDAGKYYNLYVPIAADCKVGANWAEVH